MNRIQKSLVQSLPLVHFLWSYFRCFLGKGRHLDMWESNNHQLPQIIKVYVLASHHWAKAIAFSCDFQQNKITGQKCSFLDFKLFLNFAGRAFKVDLSGLFLASCGLNEVIDVKFGNIWFSCIRPLLQVINKVEADKRATSRSVPWLTGLEISISCRLAANSSVAAIVIGGLLIKCHGAVFRLLGLILTFVHQTFQFTEWNWIQIKIGTYTQQLPQNVCAYLFSRVKRYWIWLGQNLQWAVPLDMSVLLFFRRSLPFNLII